MPLNLQNDENTTGGYIKYMASTGTWMKSEKMPDGNFGDVEFKFHQAVFDLANIQTGWGLLQKGQAPEWVMDESISKRALKPTDGREWKRGFKVSIFSQQCSKVLLNGQPMVLAQTMVSVNFIERMKKRWQKVSCQWFSLMVLWL